MDKDFTVDIGRKRDLPQNMLGSLNKRELELFKEDEKATKA